MLVLFQPHLPSRTRHLWRELGWALTAADAACVTEVYVAREEPLPGVTGKLVAEAAAEARPGMPVGWAPTVEEGARLVAAWARRLQLGGHQRVRGLDAVDASDLADDEPGKGA